MVYANQSTVTLLNANTAIRKRLVLNAMIGSTLLIVHNVHLANNSLVKLAIVKDYIAHLV
jgi:hypothetical protein